MRVEDCHIGDRVYTHKMMDQKTSKDITVYGTILTRPGFWNHEGRGNTIVDVDWDAPFRISSECVTSLQYAGRVNSPPLSRILVRCRIVDAYTRREGNWFIYRNRE